MKHYEVEILDAKTREKLCFLDKVEPQATIAEIKNLFTKTRESGPAVLPGGPGWLGSDAKPLRWALLGLRPGPADRV